MNATTQNSAPETNLMAAHRQWADRPADERFGSLEALHGACRAERLSNKAAGFTWGNVEVGLDTEGDVVLAGNNGGFAKLSAWSFGQLASKLSAPRSYLSRLPAELAAECLNHGLGQLTEDERNAEGRLLLRRDGAVPTIRAITSPSYTRIWNDDLCQRVADIGGNWKLPMQYEGGKWSAPLVPGGAYVGDRDLFLFMIDDTKRIDDGSAEGLSRGFFLWNSEVGAKSFGVSTFLYRHVCGNNIVWGASRVVESRVRHVGEANTKAFAELALALNDYANASVVEDEAAIARARTMLLGGDEETTVAQVVKVTQCSAKLAAESFKLGSQWAEVDGSPTTLWGMVNAVTRYAQLSQWTEDRVEVDGVAQRLFARVLAA